MNAADLTDPDPREEAQGPNRAPLLRRMSEDVHRKGGHVEAQGGNSIGLKKLGDFLGAYLGTYLGARGLEERYLWYMWYTDLVLSTLGAYLSDFLGDKCNPIELPPRAATHGISLKEENSPEERTPNLEKSESIQPSRVSNDMPSCHGHFR